MDLLHRMHSRPFTPITAKPPKSLYNYHHNIRFPILVYMNGLLAATLKLAAISTQITDLDMSNLLIANLNKS
jgi:hypothetical protein